MTPPAPSWPTRAGGCGWPPRSCWCCSAGRAGGWSSSSSPTPAAYAAQGLEPRLQPVDLPAPRGSILDRNGAVLAGSAEARYVYADPALVEDPARDGGRALAAARRAAVGAAAQAEPHTTATTAARRAFEYLARGITSALGDASAP